MITDSILNLLDSSISFILSWLPTLPAIPINEDIYNFLVNSFKVFNVFFDLSLVGNLLLISLGIFTFTTTMRLLYILRG